MILASQVESLLYPWPMLLTIPLMGIGIVPALLVTGHSLNVSSFTGIILLIGIVVDNAALFFEYVALLRADGNELRQSILESGRIVIRPLFLNNSTTLLGLLPAALAMGAGTEFQAALAVTVIAGLLTSVVLSLFVIPTAFYYLLRLRDAQAKRAPGFGMSTAR
jgi:multidrug efflux pump subunit AcrB